MGRQWIHVLEGNVTADDPTAKPQRLGFLAGEIAVPEDFDRMGAGEIEAMFEVCLEDSPDPPLV